MLTNNPFYELPQVHTALPGPASRALFARHDAQLTGANADHEIYPLLEVGKRGYLIEDADGNTFADHMSAWGASPFGPTPPTVKAAMDAAWARHGMQISGWLPNQAAFSLVDKLTRIAPGRLSRVEYSVSGTLAVEAAVKFMREATKRPLIITFGGQYHGESTYMTAGASSDLSNVSSGRTQYVSGVVMVPYPNRFRSPFRRGPGPVDECEVLELPAWKALADRLTKAGVDFVLPPQCRFAGQSGEQWTLFFRDPFGNPIEVKGFAHWDQVFAH